jgi:putative Holliday junction resolvase
MAPAMRILGLDVGSERIGVALSDELGLTAQPLETIQVRGGNDPLTRIVEICEEHEVGAAVVGLPLSLTGGDRGQSSRRARALGQALAEHLDMEVAYWDERFTTSEAERVLTSAGVRRAKRRQVVDKVAAALILQGFLDSRQSDG